MNIALNFNSRDVDKGDWIMNEFTVSLFDVVIVVPNILRFISDIPPA